LYAALEAAEAPLALGWLLAAGCWLLLAAAAAALRLGLAMPATRPEPARVFAFFIVRKDYSCTARFVSCDDLKIDCHEIGVFCEW
jgi:hypothetical protein